MSAVVTPGAICLDILRKEAWSPALTLERTLLSIASLLADPNPASPMDGEAASLYTKNRKAYDERVRQWVSQYARPDSDAGSSEGAWASDFGKADETPGAQTTEASTADTAAPTAPPPPAVGKAAQEPDSAGVVIELESSDDEPTAKKAKT